MVTGGRREWRAQLCWQFPYTDCFTLLLYCFNCPWLHKNMVWRNPKIEKVVWSRRTTHTTHWGRVTHICVSKSTTIGLDNGLSPGRRQAIIWTIAGILSIGPLYTKFSEIFIQIHTFSFKKFHLKMSSGKWQPFCLGLNVLSTVVLGASQRGPTVHINVPIRILGTCRE